MLLWLCIAVRVVSNPCSNALQKLLAARGFAAPLLLAIPYAGLALLIIPWLVLNCPPLPRDFWLWSLLAAGLAVAANWLIIEAIRRADLSVLGPINSYKPVVSLIPGLLLLGERPGWMALAGIGLVLAGSLLLVKAGKSRTGLGALVRDSGVQLRFAALVLSAGEAVALKRALRVSSPEIAFAWWVIFGLVFVLPFALQPGLRMLGSPSRRLPLRSAGWLATLTATTGLMQLCTLITLARMPVGIALALFQTSTLVSVFLGHAVFQEPHFRRRLAGAGVMAAGAALLVLT